MAQASLRVKRFRQAAWLAATLVAFVLPSAAVAELRRVAILPPQAADLDDAAIAALPTMITADLAERRAAFEAVRPDLLQQALKSEDGGKCGNDDGCRQRVLKASGAAWVLTSEVKAAGQKFSLTVRIFGPGAVPLAEHTETMKYLRNLPMNVPICLDAVLPAAAAPARAEEPPPPPAPIAAAPAPSEEPAEPMPPPPPPDSVGEPKLLAVLPFIDASSEGHKIDSGTKQILEEDIRTVSGGALSPWGYTVLTGDNMLSILADNGIDPGKACEASCSLQAARELKADVFVAASVALTEGSYTAILRLFESKTGRQYGFVILEGATIREIRKAFSRQLNTFFKRLMVVPSAAPSKVAVRPEPPPKVTPAPVVTPPPPPPTPVEKPIVLAPPSPPATPAPVVSVPVAPIAPPRPQAGPDLRWLGWVGVSVGLLAVAGGGGARLYAANIYNSDKVTTNEQGVRVHSVSADNYAMAGTLGQVSTYALIGGAVVAVGSGAALAFAPRPAGGGGDVSLSGTF